VEKLRAEVIGLLDCDKYTCKLDFGELFLRNQLTLVPTFLAPVGHIIANRILPIYNTQILIAIWSSPKTLLQLLLVLHFSSTYLDGIFQDSGW